MMSEFKIPTDSRIFVVIPAYKVEKQIARVVKHIPAFVEKIIVVNDASPDGTKDILASLDDPRLEVVHHEKNGGVGGAMITGYNHAVSLGADIMVKMDGDDQMDPDRIVDLVRPIVNGEADYTKGNRFLNFSQMEKMPMVRRIGNWGLTFMVKAASGYWNIFDPSNGFTALHARVWEQFNQDRIAHDYFFECSVLNELRHHNAVVRDVAIPARYLDEQSSLSISRVLLSFPLRLLWAFNRRIGMQYYLYNFTFVSIAILGCLNLLTFGGIWGIIHWMKSVQTGIPATTGTVLIAVLPIIVGMQLWLQALSEDIRHIPTAAIHSKSHYS